MAFLLGKRTNFWPLRQSFSVLRISSSLVSMLSTSTTSGSSPSKPRITAFPVPWPIPVWPNDPNSSTFTLSTESKSAAS